MRRLVTSVSWISSLSTLTLFVTALGLALHVRVGLGHWPRPMWEDYRTFAFETHFLALQAVWLLAVYAAAPLWAVCVLLPRLRLPVRVHAFQALFYLTGWGLVAGLIALDPFQFVTWLKD